MSISPHQTFSITQCFCSDWLIRYVSRRANAEKIKVNTSFPSPPAESRWHRVRHSQVWPVNSDKAAPSKSQDRWWTAPKSAEQRRSPPQSQPRARPATKHRSRSRVMWSKSDHYIIHNHVRAGDVTRLASLGPSWETVTLIKTHLPKKGRSRRRARTWRGMWWIYFCCIMWCDLLVTLRAGACLHWHDG